ncbi:tRNA (N6-threonylcarbamoyladenosine(37)-N6)-methyltransferase TrmO [bacterium]|nr:tRNA (N6-threonylcarbamoyladenosine(37)-N6)-methyltransferase TrmO [bacterium]RQV97971.1 MAG: tRNA (N6-threonylcarbamoyladenosine(37)-N6)-methyltransferase TrmO [bacterium]
MQKNKSFEIRPIGVIHTPHNEGSQTPIQPVFSRGVQGTVEIYPEFCEGLKDLEGFSHIYLLYFFDRSAKMQLQVVPYLDSVKRGVFATRAPHRPNKIGMSLVRLLKIENGILTIEDVDILDKTPLLDIKPYIQRYDSRADARSGWQENISDDVAGSLGKRDYPYC